jgi:hypothetical protein
MRKTRSKILSAAIGAALLGNSTLAAAAPAAPADPWVTLSMLNPAGATALGGAEVQSAYADDRGGNGLGNIPLPVIGVWLAVIALNIYILTAKDHGHGHIHIDVPPISPG